MHIGTVPISDLHRYLLDLGSRSDPVWFYIETKYKYIITMFIEAYEGHITRLRGLSLCHVN